MGGTDVQLQVKGQQWVEDDPLTPAELAGSEMPRKFSSVGPSLVMIPSNSNELLGKEELKERTAKEDNSHDEEGLLKLCTLRPFSSFLTIKTKPNGLKVQSFKRHSSSLSLILLFRSERVDSPVFIL